MSIEEEAGILRALHLPWAAGHPSEKTGRDVNRGEFSDGKRKYVYILTICVTQGTNSFQRTNSWCEKSLLCLIKEDGEMASQHRDRALCHPILENCELKCKIPLHTVRLWNPQILLPPRADGHILSPCCGGADGATSLEDGSLGLHVFRFLGSSCS